MFVYLCHEVGSNVTSKWYLVGRCLNTVKTCFKRVYISTHAFKTNTLMFDVTSAQKSFNQTLLSDHKF